MGKPRDIDEGPLELGALEELAARTEERAARARKHAAEARDHARRDAVRGDDQAERLHLREAEAHAAAAAVIEQTAALYRHRVRQVRSRKANRPGEVDS